MAQVSFGRSHSRIHRANGSICHRRQNVQLPDPTVRAMVDDGHRLIFVDSANVALREFVARDIRRMSGENCAYLPGIDVSFALVP